jgi:hypothetical protein
LLFFNIFSLYFNTLFNWYINFIIDGTVYPSQHFPFGAAFVSQAGNFWTLLRRLNQHHRQCVLFKFKELNIHTAVIAFCLHTTLAILTSTSPTAVMVELGLQLPKTHKGDTVRDGKINSKVHERMSFIPRWCRDKQNNDNKNLLIFYKR